jgi:metallo-beta-lactamase family protein
VRYGEPVEFGAGVRARWIEAGHILGSACIVVEMDGTRVLYSGDLGRFGVPILRDPTNPLPEADYLITECTYADREHEDPENMRGSLVRIIRETRGRGGKVIIPAFSVGRTQTITYYLQQAVARKMLEPLPVFVDSPLSAAATKVFRAHPECYDAEARDFWEEKGDVFGRGLVRYVADVEESKKLHLIEEPCVIIAASGMCEAGRILHHLKNNVEDPRNTVIVVGFMAPHTLGRRIVEREKEIKVFGEMYRLRAKVEILNGFSAHADVRDFKRLYGPLAPTLKAAFCVHGEGSQLEGMRSILTEAGCPEVIDPEPGFTFKL